MLSASHLEPMGARKGFSMMLKGDGFPVTTFILIGGILLLNGIIGGCNKGASPKPVRIAGTVTTSDGAPVSGVRLILNPDSGNVLSTAEFDLDPAGHFEGEALPGSYGYYFAPVNVERGDNGSPVSKAEAKKFNESHQSLNKLVPPAYRSPPGGASGKVQLTAGAEIALVLTK